MDEGLVPQSPKEGVHHHALQWIVIVVIIALVTTGLFAIMWLQRTALVEEEKEPSESRWAPEEKLRLLDELNARAEAERKTEVQTFDEDNAMY